jgi:hypothetical protein
LRIESAAPQSAIRGSTWLAAGNPNSATKTPMLAPRFTIRTLLIVLTLGAVVFLVAGMAVRGHLWAWGATIGVLSLAVTLIVHAAWFGLVWAFSLLPIVRRRPPGDGELAVEASPATRSSQPSSPANAQTPRTTNL